MIWTRKYINAYHLWDITIHPHTNINGGLPKSPLKLDQGWVIAFINPCTDHVADLTNLYRLMEPQTIFWWRRLPFHYYQCTPRANIILFTRFANIADDTRVFPWRPGMYFSRGSIYALYMMTSSNGNYPYKGQWRGALMFSLIFAWTNSCANNRNAGCLRRHRTHYDVTVMKYSYQANM